MKTKAEAEMERTQADVRRLKRELEEAIKAADKAWTDYVNEGPIKPVSESSNDKSSDGSEPFAATHG